VLGERCIKHKPEISNCTARSGPLSAKFNALYDFFLRLRINHDLVQAKLRGTQWKEWEQVDKRETAKRRGRLD
jgi:hypothetical protein